MLEILFAFILGLFSPTEIIYAAEPEPEPKVVLVVAETQEQRIERLIRETFHEEPDLAVAIAKAESHLKPLAVNPEWHKGCQGSYGIFQIACIHHRNTEELKDIEFNIQKAREIYDTEINGVKQKWKPWGAYRNGSYKQYLTP